MCRHTIVALAGFVFGLLACGDCRSVELDVSTLAPYQDLYNDSEIREKFVHLKAMPFERTELAFGLLIPKDWKDIPLKVSSKVALNPASNLVPLTLQLGPGPEPDPPRIEVQYTALETELHLSDWVSHYVEIHRLEVLSRTQRRFGKRLVDDLVVRSRQGEHDYLVRMSFSKHGALIFLVSGSARAESYRDYAKMFGAASVSFYLKQKPPSELAEPIRNYVNPGPPYLAFHYPASWERTEANSLPSGKIGVDIARKVSNQTVGLIHVFAKLKSDSQNSQAVLDELKKDLEASGVMVLKNLRKIELDSKQPPPLSKVDVWDASLKGAPAELATLVLANNRATYAVGMLAPLRKRNPIGWMTSWRVFEMVAKDVQRSLKR